jgi:NitT/TauT family transport system substrate-binding protein
MSKAATATLLIVALAACSRTAMAQSAVERPNIELGAAAATVSYVAPYIAAAKGYFRDEGVNVTLTNFQSGVKAAQAMMGGSVDAVVGSYSHTITLASKGQNIRYFVSFLRCPGYVVGVAKGQAATSVKDFKGLKVGVTSPGSSTHQALNYLVTRAGLAPDDYTPVAVGNTAGSVAAVEYNKIDATIVVEPIVSQLLKSNAMKMLLDMRSEKASLEGFGGPYPEGGLYAREDFIRQNPKTIQALTNAVVRADEWLQTASPEDVVKALPAEAVGSDPDTFGKSVTNMRGCFSPDGRVASDGPAHVLDILTASEPELKKASVNLADTYTNAFVEEALKKYPPTKQ